MLKLAAEFVPAADESNRLMTLRDEESLFFQTIALKGHGTRVKPFNAQGTYMAAPDGTLLASVNTRDPALVEMKLREALEKWRKMPATRNQVPALQGAYRRWRNEDYFPDDGLALRMTVRDLPRAEGRQEDWERGWNRDFAWFKKAEVKAMIPGKLVPGASVDVPSPLVERLARLHLVDIVRGQAPAFPAGAVREAALRVKVVRVSGRTVELQLEGRTRTEERGIWKIGGLRDTSQAQEQTRGVETAMYGRANYNATAGRFTSFDLVAIGSRYGASTYNMRTTDLGPAPIGFSFTMVGNSPSDRVAPAAFGLYGWK